MCSSDSRAVDSVNDVAPGNQALAALRAETAAPDIHIHSVTARAAAVAFAANNVAEQRALRNKARCAIDLVVRS